jgi:DNA-binding transcriptional LysR family regulator
MIHAGLGWSILPTPLVENVPNRGLGIIELSSSLPYGIAYRKGKLPKLLSRIIKLTIFYFQKFAPK